MRKLGCVVCPRRRREHTHCVLWTTPGEQRWLRTKHLFGSVYAPSTVGTLLREFTFGHNRQLESVLRDHLVALAHRTEILPGIADRAFVDIDSLLRPVYGHAKQGEQARPRPVTGAPRMVAHAITTARMAGASGKIMVRGDFAYGNSRVVRACINAGVEFSFVLIKNRLVQRAFDSIPDTAWTPVRYPGAVRDPDTGGWISDAEVAETAFTAYSSTAHPVTARLIVRRVKDARYRDTLFPVWRYHPFFTNSTLPTTTADVVHRAHAIIETVFSDLIDGPLAHMPSGSFGANSAWVQCAAIAHNLLRAAETVAVVSRSGAITVGSLFVGVLGVNLLVFQFCRFFI